MRELTQQDAERISAFVWSIVRRRFATVPETVAAPEDLYQYGMEGAAKAARRFERGRGASFTTWTTGAAHHAIQDGLRTLNPGSRTGRQLGVTSLDVYTGRFEGGETWLELLKDESVDVDAGLVRSALATALTKLPERQREAVLLYYAAGLNHREVGERMGITESGACLNVRHGLAKLRESPVLAGLA